MGRKAVGELERGDEHERAAECEEEIAWYVAVERESGSQGEECSTNRKKDAADDAANSRTVCVEDGPDRKSSHIS